VAPMSLPAGDRRQATDDDRCRVSGR
jgi:hypothetical protein